MRPGWLLLFLSAVVLAQPERTGREPQSAPDPVAPVADTIEVPEPVTDTVEAGIPTVPTDTRSPGKAVLLSALIPGGGQVYTGHWWKTLIIAPAELGLAGFSIRDHLAAGEALAAADTTKYDRLVDRRNALLWWTGAVVAFSMADAYVSAQMYGFDRQMRFTVGPTRVGIEVGLR